MKSTTRLKLFFFSFSFSGEAEVESSVTSETIVNLTPLRLVTPVGSGSGTGAGTGAGSGTVYTPPPRYTDIIDFHGQEKVIR